jgi:hypothetical protein
MATNDNTSDAVQNVENGALVINRDDETYRLLQTLTTPHDKIDGDINDLHQSIFIETSTGLELDKLGAEVGVIRKQGEQDDKFRKRVSNGFARATSDTTYKHVAKHALNVIDADPTEMDIDLKPVQEPEIDVKTYRSVLDDNPLTDNEIENLLQDAIAGGHGLNIKAFGTFELASDSYTPPSGTGLGEGTLKGEI